MPAGKENLDYYPPSRILGAEVKLIHLLLAAEQHSPALVRHSQEWRIVA